MRVFWIALARLCVIGLALIMFYKNFPSLCYNLFHKNKRKICWDPMADCHPADDLDDTEAFYFSDPIKFSKS